MKTLRDFNLKNKRVLVRCDFNVPLDEKGNILDDFRIKQSLPTIKYLIEKKAKIILMSHLGRPEGKIVENLRLTSIANKLKKYLNLSINKSRSCFEKEVENLVSQLQPGEILLLENLRFHKEEELNDENFAKKLSKLADIYINDAFSVSHRTHASIVGITRYLPSGMGLLFEKEIKILSKILTNFWRPLVIIIGGVKIIDKIKMIEQLLKKTDHLLLGGQIANTILEGKGLIVKNGRFPFNPEIEKIIKDIDLTNPKLHLPVDGIIALKNREEGFLRQGAIGTVKKEESIFDIGPETIKIFSDVIKGPRKDKEPKTILWLGPLGMFEEEQFEKGTKEIAKSIVRNYSAFKIVGGGDTIFALTKFNLLDKFDHICTGGGAMFEFLVKEKLPGIEALKNVN